MRLKQINGIAPSRFAFCAKRSNQPRIHLSICRACCKEYDNCRDREAAELALMHAGEQYRFNKEQPRRNEAFAE